MQLLSTTGRLIRAGQTQLDTSPTNPGRLKLRTLYKGDKKDTVIKLIARTFVALCEQADFSKPTSKPKEEKDEVLPPEKEQPKTPRPTPELGGKVSVGALQYHLNIVLPDTRDQAVYDAIFKSLRDHLG